MDHSTSGKRTLNNQTGQILVEYVLLLVIGVALAALITSTMVSRNPDSPGFLISKWSQIIQTIGQDEPDVPGSGTGAGGTANP